MALKNDGSEYFNNLTEKINNLFFGRTVKDEKLLENILDELNSINYKCAIVTSETVTNNATYSNHFLFKLFFRKRSSSLINVVRLLLWTTLY